VPIEKEVGQQQNTKGLHNEALFRICYPLQGIRAIKYSSTTNAGHVFFFFFHRRYNPLWVLAFSVILLHSVLSLLIFLHPLIPNA